jgi:two-component system cell cycle response regulator
MRNSLRGYGENCPIWVGHGQVPGAIGDTLARSRAWACSGYMDREIPAFDLTRALELVEGDGDLLVATAQRFLEQNTYRIDEIRIALDRKDLEEIERLAHGLAGACQSFAADDTERAARSLMDRAHSGDIPSLRTLVERVEAALSDLTSALSAHCTRHELRHVLIAEDDDVTRMRLEHLLTKWGHRVTSVSRGDVALEMLSPSGPPHLAIVDWMMPGLDGIDLCRALRARKSDTYTYVILITAKDDPESMLVGLEAGADDFLAKPVAPEELRARLRAGQRIVELQERLIAAREEQRRHADRDGLTGVLSRRRVIEVLEMSLSERAAGGTELALAMIDMDAFKPINDGHGHVAGDRVLRTVCERAQRILRRTDMFGRYGGDEFVVVLPDTNRREALEIGRRLCEAIASQPIESDGVALSVTASVGVATAEGAHCAREDLIKRADRALFRAKEAGGNRAISDDAEPAAD